MTAWCHVVIHILTKRHRKRTWTFFFTNVLTQNVCSCDWNLTIERGAPMNLHLNDLHIHYWSTSKYVFPLLTSHPYMSWSWTVVGRHDIGSGIRNTWTAAGRYANDFISNVLFPIILFIDDKR